MSTLRVRFTALTVASFGVVAQNLAAADFTLANKNSTMDVNITNAAAGVQSWTVDGVNYLNNQWFYFRVGAVGPEAPIQSISSTPTISLTSLSSFSRLNLTYANAAYSVQTSIKLSGSTSGSGRANLAEDIVVQNLSGAPLDFHFFQYSDFNIHGSAGGQTVQFFQNNINGEYYRAVQTDGIRTVTEVVNSSIVPLGHVEAGLFNGTLASLTDGNATTLSDSTSAGVGDVTFAYQWDVVLAPGASFQLSKLIEIVPEPSSMSILGLAALALVARKNTTRKTP
jgi:hypothetical protein